MEAKEKEFFIRLFKAFKAESEERIRTLTNGLLEWERNQDVPEMNVVVDSIYRDLHSLKGASRAVNLHDLETVFMKLEEMFAKYKRKEIQFSKDSFDHLHQIINQVKSYLINTDSDITKPFPSSILDAMNSLYLTTKDTMVSEVSSQKLPSVPSEVQKKKLPIEKETKSPAEDHNIRISRHGLDALLLQTEEFILTRNDFEYWLTELNEIKSLSDLLTTESKHARDRKIESFTQAEVLQQKINIIHQRIQKHYHQYQLDLESMRNMVRELLMVPFREISEFFPKNIRDLAFDLGKEVSYFETGGEILIDRRILENLREPFLHLIRNSIDHGIETVQKRKQLGKSVPGRITIHIQKVKGQMIEILFEDDGAGFDFDTIRTKLLNSKDLSQESVEKMEETELINALFAEGISSKEVVTTISGRGLGLSIVRTKIEQMGGSLSVESRKNKGSVFSVRLPTELTSYRGLLVAISDRIFAIPTSQIEKVIKINKKDLQWVENHYTFSYLNQMMSVYSLQEILGINLANTGIKEGDLFLLLLGDKEVLAYLVDNVLYEQDLLARPLDPISQRTPLLSGVAVIRSDLTVPILNVGEILSITSQKHNLTFLDTKSTEELEKKRKVLIVEDSITSRMILKNILETEGYHVSTAVDGFEATLHLKRERFDLVVSDIEMPKMNGFEMTQAIRSTDELRDIPVVLVTTMDSREDREKGLNSGADAYIVKSSFDQSNLIDVVRNLLE